MNTASYRNAPRKVNARELSFSVLSSIHKTPKRSKSSTDAEEDIMLMTKPDKQKSKLLTVKEVAAYLVVTERTVYRLIKDPNFPAFKVGGQWRFKIDLIDDWMRRERGQGNGALELPNGTDEALMENAGRLSH
jgi:excisionase family DNA binding protein